MIVAPYRGRTVGKFHIYAEERDGEQSVRVRHTVDEKGNYYEEKLTPEQAFEMGMALLRDYSLHTFGVG